MQVSLEEPFRFNPAMASAPTPANDSLERQTRQEISSLVAELGQLSSSHCSMPEFWNGYVSRLSRAMAAEGVTIWSLSDPSEPQSIMALGELSVDPQHAGHRLLLAEVFQSMKPVLVPPSAGEQTGRSIPPTHGPP